MKRALITVAAMLLPGCGFQPLYADNGNLGVSSTLSTIYVEPISERVGYELRNDLLDRLDGSNTALNARYRLKLYLTELEEPVVFQPNTSITRYNYTLTAHYDLVPKDAADAVKSGDVTAFAAYNVAASPYLYSTVAAQRDAKNRAATDIAERIRIELAVYLRQVAEQTR
jgi:LPS-assembly lipoprotein